MPKVKAPFKKDPPLEVPPFTADWFLADIKERFDVAMRLADSKQKRAGVEIVKDIDYFLNERRVGYSSTLPRERTVLDEGAITPEIRREVIAVKVRVGKEIFGIKPEHLEHLKET